MTKFVWFQESLPEDCPHRASDEIITRLKTVELEIKRKDLGMGWATTVPNGGPTVGIETGH